eukprot:2708242-Prymnesium_polylepis.2
MPRPPPRAPRLSGREEEPTPDQLAAVEALLAWPERQTSRLLYHRPASAPVSPSPTATYAPTAAPTSPSPPPPTRRLTPAS